MISTEVTEFLSKQQHAELRIDRRQVKPGDIFVAIPGAIADGRKYIAQAIANGASAILYESQDAVNLDINIPYLPIENLSTKLPSIAAAHYGHSSQHLKLFAITGTNGKSSTAHYIAQFLTAQNFACGVMGTLGNGLYPNLSAAELTTGDCCTLQSAFNKFKSAAAQYVSLEVSSHALAQNRFAHTQIDTAVFSNLSQDHLDYHKDMQDYFNAKTKLFTEFNAKHCVINLDDAHGRKLLELIPSHSKVITYSIANPNADLYLQDNVLHTPWGSGVLQTQLIGAFNISNLLSAIACCALQGISISRLLELAPTIHPVMGRMELVSIPNIQAPKIVVDYAHTPDALIKVLQALRAYNPRKLICVFGCGGDRDRTKRPLMMQAVLTNSDECVVTMDNPRTEDPQRIIHDMICDIPATDSITIELDRANAIQKAITQASHEDILLIAGKGHEDYQIIGTIKHPFSDQNIARDALKQKIEETQMQLTVKQICEHLNVPFNGVDATFTSVSTDTRSIKPGALFVALCGSNFDGHDFISDAIKSGATGVVISKPCDVNVPSIAVNDTLRAYGQIAALHRSKFNIPMVAVTGSCGKTTVQSMVAAILRKVGNTLSPAGSFNNEVGLPRTLLELNSEHKYAVLEMGARKPGDIQYLMELVQPSVTLVNNVAPAHTETFGSLETIATTKGEIYKHLIPTGTAIINVDDAYAPYWLSSLTAQRVITCGLEHAADITCSYIVEEHHRSKIQLVTDIGETEVFLPLLGMHNVRNAIAAAAVARALDVPLHAIKDGLESFKPVTRRMEIRTSQNGAKIIDDSYNANPLAMSYAVDVLSKQAGTKIMVIGDMLELGALSEDKHRALGQQAKAAGIDKLLAYGDFTQLAVTAFGQDAKFYSDKNQLIEELRAMLNPSIVVLVKGSHGMRMNEVVNALI